MSIFALACLFTLAQVASASFVDEQLQFARVRQAKQNVDQALQQALKEQGFAYPPKEILFRVLKRDKRFEVWADKAGRLELARAHPICASSGRLGPKVKSGDGQVPEGLYAISQWNPNSNFHVSLRVDYPNAVDRARSSAIFGRAPKPGELGGDIYVHGDCVTIGCVPLTDPIAEEVYWFAVLARQAGQARIPIHIFPTRLEPGSVDQLLENAPDPHTRTLWQDLAPIYQRFEAEHRVPEVETRAGRYLLKRSR